MSDTISNNDESDYKSQVEALVRWCEVSNLQLHNDKIKEMIIDTRRNRSAKQPLIIHEKTDERVETSKFFGFQFAIDITRETNSTQFWKSSKAFLFSACP